MLAPLSQRWLLWGQTWWDKCTWRAPSGNTINDIHDHLGAKKSGSKWTLDWFSCRTSPQLGLDLSSGTSHTISVHLFIKDPSAKCLRMSLNPIHWGGRAPFHPCKWRSAKSKETRWGWYCKTVRYIIQPHPSYISLTVYRYAGWSCVLNRHYLVSLLFADLLAIPTSWLYF